MIYFNVLGHLQLGLMICRSEEILRERCESWPLNGCRSEACCLAVAGVIEKSDPIFLFRGFSDRKINSLIVRIKHHCMVGKSCTLILSCDRDRSAIYSYTCGNTNM